MKMYITTTPLLLLLLLALVRSSPGDDITISSEDDFKDFVNNVNSGKTNYLGTTVYLGSDFALSGSIDPIGNGTINYFRGVFDGQGHIISNLKMNVSSAYTGLFGYSKGLTIRNVVLDDSCSITSSFKGSGSEQSYVGGIIGKCQSNIEKCTIESSVNMADVTFSGNTSSSLFIGGIIGYLSSPSSSYNAYAKNCVNYGSVTHSGTVGKYAELGGVVGLSSGNSLYNHIQNCLNYGTITHNGTSENLYAGGVVGNSARYAYIENCVSAGKISTRTTGTAINYIGSIIGMVGSTDIHINYCYYTSDVNASSINGTGTPETIIGTPNSPTSVDPDLVNKLNSNATSCNWDNWFMLHLNGGSINNLTQELLVEIQGHIPNPVKEGNSFLFWYKDAECVEEFDPETEPVGEITDLYAGWTPNNYTVTFDFDNGTTVNVTFSYNTEITYPDMKKEGYTFSQWNNYHELMPASDITVIAQWIPNNYTVTYDFGNGTTVNVTFSYNTEIVYPDVKKEGYTLSWGNYHELMPAGDITVTAQWIPNNYTVTFDANGGSISKASIIITFNEKYGDLPEPKKEGYIFIGWFTNKSDGTEVTNETTVTTPYNHTLYAHWEEVTNHVEIVFNTKDLTKEGVEKLINQYTEAGFTIVKYENESEGIRIIIGFANEKEAENFITNIKESSEMENVKRIGFVIDDYPGSFLTMVYPLPFFNTLFL